MFPETPIDQDIALSLLILVILTNFFGIIAYSREVRQVLEGTFFRPIVTGIAALGLVSIVVILYVSVIPVDSVSMLIASGILISIRYGVIVLRLVLKEDEREIIRSCLPAFASKLIPSQVL